MLLSTMAERFIIDTDAGGDPDDALAIALACRLPNVAAIVTSDETPDGARARFVQRLVLEMGADIPVYTGLQSPHPGKHILGKLALTGTRQPPSIYQGFCEHISAGSTHWVGIGSYTNLAWLHTEHPELAEGLEEVMVMGGRLQRDADTRPEHNVKVDPAAAQLIAAAYKHLLFVPSTITKVEQTEVGAGHEVLDLLEEVGAKSAVHNFKAWFEGRYPSSYQHDALTLGIACRAVDYAFWQPVMVSPQGRLTHSPGSTALAVADGVDYDAMWAWAKSLLHT